MVAPLKITTTELLRRRRGRSSPKPRTAPEQKQLDRDTPILYGSGKKSPPQSRMLVVKMCFRLIPGKLLLASLAICSSWDAYGQALDSNVAARLEQDQVTIEARGATRRQLLQRLFAERSVRVDWHDGSSAEEVIDDSLIGPINHITRRVLAPTNF